jgi:hypothetical protein
MRTTRALIAGFGTTGTLVAAVACVFIVASAVVAFNGWPHLGIGDRIDSLFVKDRPAVADSTGPQAVAGTAATAAGTVAAVPTGSVVTGRGIGGGGGGPGQNGAGRGGSTPGSGGSGDVQAGTGTTTGTGGGGGGNGTGVPDAGGPTSGVSGAVQNTAHDVGGAVSNTTNQVGQSVGSVNQPLGDTVSQTGSSVQNTVNNLLPSQP